MRRSVLYYAAPVALAVVAIVAVAPFLLLVHYSVTDLSFSIPGRDGTFAGFSNYARAWSDQRFRGSLATTTAYTLAAVLIELIIGIGVALLLPLSRRAARVVLPFLTLPIALSGIAVGLQWRLLLHGDFGAVVWILRAIGLLNEGSVLGDPSRALAAVILADLWQWAPFCCLITYVTRLGVPNELLLAARLDGAGAWRVNVDILMPQLRTPVLVCALFRAADCFRDMDKVLVLTGGGPGSATEVLSLYLWNVSFVHGDLGYGAALTVIVYLLTLSFVWISLRRVRTT